MGIDSLRVNLPAALLRGGSFKDFLTTGINQVCSCDITYISILFVFVYLAVIIDIYSRQLVGYAIVKSLSPQEEFENLFAKNASTEGEKAKTLFV